MGPARTQEWAFIPHNGNCEWYPDSQARETSSFPALGWLQIWAASQLNCFALLSAVGTNPPCNNGIKSLRALVPLLKEQGAP